MREGVRVNDNRWFAAWVVVGCAVALSMVSIGLLVLRTTCWQHGTATGCDEHLNPLPWLALGVAFVVGGFVAHRLRRR